MMTIEQALKTAKRVNGSASEIAIALLEAELAGYKEAATMTLGVIEQTEI